MADPGQAAAGQEPDPVHERCRMTAVAAPCWCSQAPSRVVAGTGKEKHWFRSAPYCTLLVAEAGWMCAPSIYLRLPMTWARGSAPGGGQLRGHLQESTGPARDERERHGRGSEGRIRLVQHEREGGARPHGMRCKLWTS